VAKLVAEAVEAMPWCHGESLPTLRKWAELELIRLAVFSAITRSGILSVNTETREVGVKRLVDDHRKISMSQLVLERELRMTPLVRAQLQSSGEQPMAMMAQAEEPPEKEPPDDPQPLEDPPPDKESPTEPGQPAPMKSDS
jgi:hypothetical protein